MSFWSRSACPACGARRGPAAVCRTCGVLADAPAPRTAPARRRIAAAVGGALLVLASSVGLGLWLRKPDQAPVEVIKRARSAPKKSAGRLATGEKVNINLAGLAELQRLHGVGPMLADCMMAFRLTYGAFQSESDFRFLLGSTRSTMDERREQIEYGDGRTGPIDPEFLSKYPTRYDMNAMSESDMIRIPYLKEAIAHYIVDYRGAHGGYRSMTELMDAFKDLNIRGGFEGEVRKRYTLTFAMFFYVDDKEMNWTRRNRDEWMRLVSGPKAPPAPAGSAPQAPAEPARDPAEGY